jgi:hypothetical protein
MTGSRLLVTPHQRTFFFQYKLISNENGTSSFKIPNEKLRLASKPREQFAFQKMVIPYK